MTPAQKSDADELVREAVPGALGMKTRWTYAVNGDGQIDINFVATDDRGGKVTGGVTLLRANSLAVALGVLQHRPDVAIDVTERMRIVAALRGLPECPRSAATLADDIEAGRL